MHKTVTACLESELNDLAQPLPFNRSSVFENFSCNSPTKSSLDMKGTFLVISCFLSLVALNSALDKVKSLGSFKMFLCRASGIMWSLKSEEELETNKMHQICNEDFRRGFSVWCEPVGAPENTTVSFYIGGTLERRETSSPYYLKGNSAKKVHAMFFENVILSV